MNDQEILAAFKQDEGFPREALEAAAADRARLAPIFISLIEAHLALPPAERPKNTPFFFIFHLLGDWRETAAYRPLARFLRLPDEDISWILGDGVTTTSHRVMMGVFDGDPQPLFDIVLDTEADEFIRSRMCNALAMLVLRGELDQRRVAAFLRDGFANLRPQAVNFVWFGWMEAIARLGLKDYTSLVETAFERHWIDPGICDTAHFLEELAEAQTGDGPTKWLSQEDGRPFGNTIEELSQWAAFREETIEEQVRREALANEMLKAELRERGWSLEGRGRGGRHPLDVAAGYGGTQTPIRSVKVGRNEPCPCGSGQKYKKCCGRAST